jgi:hypothetical protein
MIVMDIIKSYQFPILIENYILDSYKKDRNIENMYDLIYEYSEFAESINRWKNIKSNYDNC